MLLSRTDRSYFSEWWWTVDRFSILLVMILLVFGLVMALAASPAVAMKLGIDEMHFVKKQLQFVPMGFALMIGISFIKSDRLIRTIALGLFVVGVLLMVYGLVAGNPIKGSYRWVYIGFMNLQPSEVVKPGFVVLISWLYAMGIKDKEFKGWMFATALLLIFISLLILQPDMGQTILVTSVWVVILTLAGTSLWILLSVLGIFIVAAVISYFSLGHFASRINRFINPESGDTYQVDMAFQSFAQGGWFGKGPGESSVKILLPDAHTDFVFAVIGEEFGVVGCLLIIIVYLALIFNFMRHAFAVQDMFRKLSIIGLSTLFGMQAAINIGVNLNLLPAKGMTLPFISSGGSSLMSAAILIGLLLSLTRHEPDPNIRNIKMQPKPNMMPKKGFANV